MQDDEAGPSLSLGLYRLSGLFASVVVVVYIFWEMFSQSAALIRLSMLRQSSPEGLPSLTQYCRLLAAKEASPAEETVGHCGRR
ncbi:hypothetical protein BMW22_26725 (plasmid) [Rhizobium leguminosarum]|uniref:Uncharacterized protein n=1 Tax=Rhizobium leguminosarum TaxID=384 RepID=A0A1L3ZHW1_RHILE|nr:hypothetical protein BMW22_26725 [Rhizobium leguminosarum]